MTSIEKIIKFKQDIEEVLNKELEFLKTGKDYDAQNHKLVDQTISYFNRMYNIYGSRASSDDDDDNGDVNDDDDDDDYNNIFDDDYPYTVKDDNKNIFDDYPIMPNNFFTTNIIDRSLMGINSTTTEPRISYYGSKVESSDEEDEDEDFNINPVINNTKISLKKDLINSNILLDNEDSKIYDEILI